MLGLQSVYAFERIAHPPKGTAERKAIDFDISAALDAFNASRYRTRHLLISDIRANLYPALLVPIGESTATASKKPLVGAIAARNYRLYKRIMPPKPPSSPKIFPRQTVTAGTTLALL